MPGKLSSLLQGFLRRQTQWITLIVLLLFYSQTRYITDAYKTEVTGNTYMHTHIT